VYYIFLCFCNSRMAMRSRCYTKTMAQAKQEDKAIPQYGSDKCKAPCAVLLWSSLSSTSHQTAAQKKCSDTMVGLKIRLEQLDGAQAENKALRNKLFNCSNVRGKYPQIFIKNEKGELSYIGMDDQFQYLCDAEKITEVMKACME